MGFTVSFLCNDPLYDKVKPYEMWVGGQVQGMSTNARFHTVPIEVTSLRETNISQDIDKLGFEYVSHDFSTSLQSADFQTPGQPQRIESYILEVISFIKKRLHAEQVICHDWRYRHAEQKDHQESNKGRSEPLPPAYIVHIDDSPNEAKTRAIALLGKEKFKQCMEKGIRMRIINVWKPLVEKVETDPLIVCDRRTVVQSDIVAYDKVHSDHVREGIFVLHNSEQKWYFLPEQQNNELALFTIWDSRIEGGPSGCPHGSLRSSHSPAIGKARESIEVRLLVVDVIETSSY